MELWLSCPQMTVCVAVEDGKVIKAPAVVKKFAGQPVKNLTQWLRKISAGQLDVVEIGIVETSGKTDDRAKGETDVDT